MTKTTSFNPLCSPKTHAPLRLQGPALQSEDGTTYSIQNGIPVLLSADEVTGLNRKYQRLYDRIARGYDFAFWFYAFFSPKIVSMRKSLLQDMVVKPGMHVLETSIGTGLNIPFFTKEAHYYGIDISMGMLKICQRKLNKLGYGVQLAQANAEELPYQDNCFDVVFHVGGINFFNDIPKAIAEMIRVAKPGAQILISDETQEHVDKAYKRIPFVRRFFTDAQQVVVPLEYIPSHMRDVKLSYSDDKRMYVISFFKP